MEISIYKNSHYWIWEESKLIQCGVLSKSKFQFRLKYIRSFKGRKTYSIIN